jgi:hypothetical protein
MRRPGRHPRSTLAKVASRVSNGSRRRSSPSSSNRSKAKRKTCRPEGLRRSRANTATPLSSQETASPSIRHERALSQFTASTISGYRGDQSLPFQVNKWMPTGSGRGHQPNRGKPRAHRFCASYGNGDNSLRAVPSMNHTATALIVTGDGFPVDPAGAHLERARRWGLSGCTVAVVFDLVGGRVFLAPRR